MAKLSYTTSLSTFKKGDNSPCYTAHIKHNGTVSSDDFIKRLAERSGEERERVRFIWELAQNELARQLAAGKRIELEAISAGIAVAGSFDSANATWNPEKNKLVPFINAKGELKNALADLETENITEGAKPTILSVLDAVAEIEAYLTGSGECRVYISGKDLAVNSSAEDEGVWLEDTKGVVAATGTVTESDSSTVNCSFDALPDDGDYKLVVATRGGMGAEFGVALAKKSVKVVKDYNS